MESLIRSSFGRASPSRMMLEDCFRQSPGSAWSACRSQSRADEETRSGPSGDSSRPPSVAMRPQSSPETPRRPGTPSTDAVNVHIDDDEDGRRTSKRSPPVPLDADSSTFTTACQNRDHDLVEQERREKDVGVVDETSASGPLKRRASDVEGLPSTAAKRRADQRQHTRQNADVEYERPTSTSGRLTALESLQGLVYRQTANSEHPLDSLQRLIYGGSGAEPSHMSVQLAAGQTTAGSETDQFQTGRSPVLAPQTLILVNPIVTVVSQGGGSEAPLHGGPSTPKPSATTGGGGGSAGESSGSSEDAGEQAVPAPRIYRCRACRRKFSSKGSYRYHLSRCHMLGTAASPKAACEAPTRHKFHSHLHHHRNHDPAAATDPSDDVTISTGSTFGGCAPLEDSGRHLQAQYFAEAK